MFIGIQVPHGIRAVHFTHHGSQGAPGNVLMKLPLFQCWLFADHPFALDFPVIAGRIKDVPVTLQKLDGTVAVIFDGDAVGEDILIRQWPGILDLKKGFYRYFNITRDQRFHVLV